MNNNFNNFMKKEEYIEYENLPLRESRSEYLTKIYGNMYNIHKFDHKWYRKDKNKHPWNIAIRIIENNIGKSFNLAFSYFCKKVPKHEQYYFLREFENPFRLNYYPYIDNNGNIQKEERRKIKKQEIIIRSKDYTEEYYNKINNRKIEKINILHYPSNRNLYTACYRHYNAKYFLIHESNIITKIIKGNIITFDSKKDLRYKRYISELKKKNKSKKLKLNKQLKAELEVEYIRKIRRLETQKEREETRIKLEAKGFRKNAFTKIII